MTLTGASILARQLIKNANSAGYRNCSYDLTVGTLVTPDGQLVEEYALPPQGLAKVVSAETVSCPLDLLGYVLVKTSLCNEGILPLNIGIVDPGFEGPLQSCLINFGKQKIRLRRGDVFSRITFHELEAASGTQRLPPLTTADVVTRAQAEVDLYLPDTFMNIGATAQVAADKAFGKYRTTMFAWLPILAIVLTLLTFALNFGNMWLLQSYLKPQDQARTEFLREEMESRLAKLETNRAQLSEQIQTLTKELHNAGANAPPSQPKK
jgi:deoxycytidine triphosphate deaminase